MGCGQQERLATLAGHTDEVNSLAFSPDLHTLISASADHTVIAWNTITQQTATRICTDVGHNLTQEERSQFAPDISYHQTLIFGLTSPGCPWLAVAVDVSIDVAEEDFRPRTPIIWMSGTEHLILDQVFLSRRILRRPGCRSWLLVSSYGAVVVSSRCRFSLTAVSACHEETTRRRIRAEPGIRDADRSMIARLTQARPECAV